MDATVDGDDSVEQRPKSRCTRTNATRDNYDLVHLLSGARAREAQEGEKKQEVSEGRDGQAHAARSKVMRCERGHMGRIVAALGVLALLGCQPALAHHAFAAEFDANKPIKFSGTVTKMSG